MEDTGYVANAKPQQERRRKVRTPGPIPARVRGRDSCGKAFVRDAVLDNLSSCGLYLRVAVQVDERALLSVSFSLSAGSEHGQGGTQWQSLGIVRRVEPQADGSQGLGIEFKRYRQVYQDGGGPRPDSDIRLEQEEQ